ncbi:MAG TPA: YolD-like family protein [Candidatus Jeotgalicoccus stercoravium]|nr:YolD-like family protein [Candidatus Jeotgalicoccus stercoravium]
MDYCNLSSQQANLNIPLSKRKGKIERPILSDNRLKLIETILEEAVQDNKVIRIEYLYDGGCFYIELEVIKIDQWSMLLIGQKYKSEDFVFVPFLDILNIEYI